MQAIVPLPPRCRRPGARRRRRSRHDPGQPQHQDPHRLARVGRRDRRRAPSGRAGSAPACPRAMPAPRAKTSTGSHRPSTNGMLCSTIRNVLPHALSSRIISPMRSISTGLMPPAGSSSRISLRVEHQDLRELDELLLAVGQRPRALVAEVAPSRRTPAAPRRARPPGRSPRSASSCRQRNARSGATTFSSTVISRNSRVIWNVRPSPRCARVHGRSPSIRRPSNVTAPRVRAHRLVDQVEDGRLARAVRPDQPGDRALAHVERAAVDRAAARRSAWPAPSTSSSGGSPGAGSRRSRGRQRRSSPPRADAARRPGRPCRASAARSSRPSTAGRMPARQER